MASLLVLQVQAEAERTDYDLGPGLVIQYPDGVQVQAPPQVGLRPGQASSCAVAGQGAKAG